jgi:protein-S-isoprenylcysteine O-methyltransferase Ste14
LALNLATPIAIGHARITIQWFHRIYQSRSIANMPTNFPNDNAGVIAPAPVLYGIAFAIGFVAEKAAPTQLLPFPVNAWLGLTCIAIAIAIVVSAFKALAHAHTAFDARKSTTKIVTTGAFRLSRNPTYLSLTLLLIGIAFTISSLWVLVSVIPAVVATQWGVILREEGYLKEKFGDGYSRYASKVRRWL